MVLGGAPPVSADPATPTSPQCRIDNTTVTCSGDLSDGVLVDAGTKGTYTDLVLTRLSKTIAPPRGSDGIKFSSDSSDISIAVDASEFGIQITGDGNSDTPNYGLFAHSETANHIKIELDGDIKTLGDDSNAVRAEIEGDGDVKVVVNGNINTSGDDSTGIITSAIGTTEVTVNGDINTAGHASLAINTNSLGNGNSLVTVKGNIKTAGADSDAIYTSAYDDGNAIIAVTGNINTSGDDSHAIYAYAGADVRVGLIGNINTKGSGSGGIVATSDDGNIHIGLHSGSVSAAQGNAVQFIGNGDNLLTIMEKVTIQGGSTYQKDGMTSKNFDVHGGDGNEKIINLGQLSTPGIIDLGGGRNSFDNRPSSIFESGESVILGSRNAFTNWGEFSPGGTDSVQHTALIGYLINKPNSQYTVTINPSAKGDKNDQLTILGRAILLGGTVKVSSTAKTYDGSYTILTASEGVKGRFDKVLDTIFADNTLSYKRNAVTLSSKSKGFGFCHFARTKNQRSVCTRFSRYANNKPSKKGIRRPITQGNSLNSSQVSANGTTADSSGGYHSPTHLELALLNQSTEDGFRSALDDLSGEVHASLKGSLVDVGQTTVAAINRRITTNVDNTDAHTATASVANLSLLADDRSGLWITGYHPSAATAATSRGSLIDMGLGGVLLGFDRELNDRWRFGVLGGYGQTGVDQPIRSSAALVDTWSVGAYGGAEAGTTRLSFGTLYSGHTIAANRSVHIDTFSEQLSASYGARSWQIFGEAAQQIQAANLMLEPFAGLSSVSLHTDGFSETGGEEAALTASSDTNRTAFTTLGLRGAIALRDKIQAQAMVGWRHAFGDRNPSSSLRLSNSSAGTVTGVPIAVDALVTELGLKASVSDSVNLGVAYHGRYEDGAADHGFKADLKLRF